MGKWEMVRLGDIVEKPQSGEWGNEDKSGTGVPVLRTTNFTDDGIIDYTNVVFREISSNKFEKKALRYGDIIIEKSGGSDTKPVGRVVYYAGASGQYIYNNFTACLRVNIDNVDTRYLFLLLFYYYKSGITAKYENKTTGIHNLRLNDFLSDIKIPIPSLDEQKRIAKNLDLASEIVKGYKEQLAELDKLVQSVFHEMFGDPVTNEKGWDISALSNHLVVIGGYAFKSENFSEEGIPVLRIGNINSGRFKSSNLVFWKVDNKLERYMVYPGDLLISLTGTVGKEDYGNICVIGHEYNCYYLNQRNAKLKLNGELDTYYLSFLLKATEIKGKLTGISRDVRQANISNSDILHLVVPVPPLPIQTRFAAIVTEIEAQKAQVQQALTEAENLFNSLMQEYFE